MFLCCQHFLKITPPPLLHACTTSLYPSAVGCSPQQANCNTEAKIIPQTLTVTLARLRGQDRHRAGTGTEVKYNQHQLSLGTRNIPSTEIYPLVLFSCIAEF